MSEEKSYTELAVTLGRIEEGLKHVVDRLDRFEAQYSQRLTNVENTLTDQGKKIVALEADKKPKSPVAAWIAIVVSGVVGLVSLIRSLF